MKNAFRKLIAMLLLACLLMGMSATAFADNESIHIKVLNKGDIYFGDEVALWANVNNVEDGYFIIWEMETETGWVKIGEGQKYTFIVTPGNANNVYRAVLVLGE